MNCPDCGKMDVGESLCVSCHGYEVLCFPAIAFKPRKQMICDGCHDLSCPCCGPSNRIEYERQRGIEKAKLWNEYVAQHRPKTIWRKICDFFKRKS